MVLYRGAPLSIPALRRRPHAGLKRREEVFLSSVDLLSISIESHTMLAFDIQWRIENDQA
jgi:hypothetical protein